ncbi:MAG: 23S rRNA (adenine(2503)-C(2))-methyltransferase RlmN [Candidatus Scalindua sp.]|nr:23S rRNA (adenine(2503)-C(2))-methyltransferase RlmN [Candidatus Scalindua sp.]
MVLRSFFDQTLSELQSILHGKGKEVYRAGQLYKWVYQKGVYDFGLMTNISKIFRAELPQLLSFPLPRIEKHCRSQDGTQKFLIYLGDGQAVESVLIPSDGRLTLCVSSEVGCNFGCLFCFTGRTRMKRRLTAGEIVAQYLLLSKLQQANERITNIVFMGMGEPLDNPDGVFRAIEIFTSELGINFPRKKITLSTAGIARFIPRVTEARVRLTVSLNGVDNKVRSRLMPVNKHCPINELMDACRKHAQISGDKVTFSYIIIKGITDSLQDARELFRLTRYIPCKINIIPYNPFPGSSLERPSEEKVMKFHQTLLDLGAHALYRRSKGADILAACGQLTTKPESREDDY